MAHGTTEPTEKYLEATATPISPVCGSMATMEKVDTVGSVCAMAAPVAKKTKMDNKKYFFIDLSPLSLYVARHSFASASNFFILVLLMCSSWFASFAPFAVKVQACIP